MLKRHSITKKSFIPFDVALSKKYFFFKILKFCGRLRSQFSIHTRGQKRTQYRDQFWSRFCVHFKLFIYTSDKNSEKHPTSGLSFRFGCGANFGPASGTIFDTHLGGKKYFFSKLIGSFFRKLWISIVRLGRLPG